MRSYCTQLQLALARVLDEQDGQGLTEYALILALIAVIAPSLSTSDETLTIEESMNLEGENGERRNVGDEHEWSWSCG